MKDEPREPWDEPREPWDEPRKPSDYRPPQNPKELLERYANGERWFGDASLRAADLRAADLSGAVLHRADLKGASLSGTDLRHTDLSNANLSNADLLGAYLPSACLQDADLHAATLNGANLHDADLNGARLRSADLADADLRSADLADADLSIANLSGANLSGANLLGTDLTGANLKDTRLSKVIVGWSHLSDIDMSTFCEVEPDVVHEGPSYVSFSSIVQSLRAPNLEMFIVRTGIPAIAAQHMIEAAQAVTGSVFNMMRSTFISYGAPDESFAKKLYEALHKNGVTTFLFSEHAEPGERLHRMMRKGVNEHDRVVLICSKASLDRKGVMNELEETLAREAREGGETFLIPIRLDDYVFTGWKPKREDIAQAVRDRVVADFEGADTDAAKFETALSKLLRTLRKKEGLLGTSGGGAGAGGA